nr:hypothetical protein [Mycolicibacterium gadium]
MSTEVVCLSGARLAFGDRVLWDHLDLKVAPGEFIAILGPRPSPRSPSRSRRPLRALVCPGTATIEGGPIEAGSERIVYVPQHRSVDRGLSLRGRDLVRLGVDGHHWGIGPLSPKERQHRNF